MSTIDRLHSIDARALALGKSLSALADETGVAPATMAKMRKEPGSVRVRVYSRLEAKLAELETAK